MNDSRHLEQALSHLQKLRSSPLGSHEDYAIPGLWRIDQKEKGSDFVNPLAYFVESLRTILARPEVKIERTSGGDWTKDAVIYNVFVRTTCAVDHDRNGKLDLPVNSQGWRETGSFMKALTMLPYIGSLGVNTIHLLPITAIGSDGNKGTLGSPYAIRNPYRLDEHLSEPNLGFGVEEEFRLFVDAAHRLGMRVVVEFVFRTSSKDGDWVREHPEWYYWIKSSVHDRKAGDHDESKYGNPIFTPEELKTILEAVEEHRLKNLIPPHESYRSMFLPAPRNDAVRLEKGKYKGVSGGEEVRIPGAFADWPPDDSQPPWGDVTYLKMYDHPDFNYIAYNTIRMYDEALTVEKNIKRSLWDTIAEIIPHYQKEFGINGVMIDMGHALPMELKKRMIGQARSIDPDFAFWDENFSISERSVREGYNAVIGYQWSDQHHPAKFKSMLQRFATEGFALPFFATAESHNTPRAAAREGGLVYSRYAWAISNFIPAIPFIHSGFEIGETFPINTGLDFTRDELKKLPSEKLPLFSEYAYRWDADKNIVDWIRKVASVRNRYRDCIINSSKDSFVWLETSDENVFAFVRQDPDRKTRLLIVGNMNMKKSVTGTIPVENPGASLQDLLEGGTCAVSGKGVEVKLNRGQVAVFRL
ncbi:MAG TPA: alpha-amylase family glycosyl hydrolase [Bacteroidota bacterium]|nr:alpha-amylase family glycosyl hydrolase [Bacteroidota bacterium]